jgi:hypothetical protein
MDQAERIGRNEALYRDVNEHIRRVGSPSESMMTILCECGSDACTEEIRIPVTEYNQLRGEPTLFVLVPGHEIQAFEEVVEDEGVFRVVRKRPGKPEAIARATSRRKA